jgi:hypothetical protein
MIQNENCFLQHGCVAHTACGEECRSGSSGCFVGTDRQGIGLGNASPAGRRTHLIIDHCWCWALGFQTIPPRENPFFSPLYPDLPCMFATTITNLAVKSRSNQPKGIDLRHVLSAAAGLLKES